MNKLRTGVWPAILLAFVGCADLQENVADTVSGPPKSGEDISKTWVDPETTISYVMNPNRRIVLGDAKSAESYVEPGGITVERSAINASGNDTDWSGRVQVQIAECISGGFQGGSISIGCQVSSEFVLIGGGAQDVWNHPGALLWESRPQDVNDFGTGTTWLASSKDHKQGATHRLHAWAVGLRLRRADGTFLSHDELKQHISYRRVIAPQSGNPTSTCIVPVGKVLIGGGARANWQGTGGAGQLLTRSFPSNATTWLGASKDHLQGSGATLDVNCIGINPSVSGVGNLIIDRVSVSNWTSSGVGTAFNNVTNSPKSVPACYGGEATWDGAKGRMLFRMAPGDGDIRTFTASSKDHIERDSGWTTAWLTQIRLQ